MTSTPHNLQDLSERINRIDDLMSKGANLKAAIQIVDLTEQQIRDALNITSRQLTMPVIKKALAKALGNTPRVTPLEEKLAGTQRNVDQNTADIAKGKQRLDLGDKRHKGTERRINQLSHLTKVLGDRLAETHDLAVKGNVGVTEEQVNALVTKALEKGKAGGRKSFMQTLLDAGVDKATLSSALTIVNLDDETDLTDNELFTEFLTAFIALKSKVDDHESRLGNVETNDAAQDTEIRRLRDAVNQNVNDAADLIDGVHDRLDGTTMDMELKRPYVMAGLVFLIVFIGGLFYRTMNGVSKTNGKVNGTAQLQISWVPILGLALVLAGITLYGVKSLVANLNTPPRPRANQVNEGDNAHRPQADANHDGHTAPIQPVQQDEQEPSRIDRVLHRNSTHS